MGTQPPSKSVEAEPQAPGESVTPAEGTAGAAAVAPTEQPSGQPSETTDAPGSEPASPARPAPDVPGGPNAADSNGNGRATHVHPRDDAAPEKALDVEVMEVEELTTTRRKRRLTSWVGLGAKKVVSKIYATSADDLEERARRAVGSAYRDQADDLEERAVRAMRQAILSEADKIKEAVEHGVEIKRREVRLSLVVLVTASLVYLALYWFTRSGPAG